jgi:hypothetical protein
MRLGIKSIAMETIAYQDSLAELESLFLELEKVAKRSSTHMDFVASKEVRIISDSISSYIFERFGIKTRLELDTTMPGAVYILPINSSHVLIPEQYHGAEEIDIGRNRLVNSFNNKTGTIDLEKVKVGGIFSMYEHKLLLGFYSNMENFRLTIRETVAIVLHEIGHVFTYYQMSDKMAKVNYILNELSDDIKNGKEDKLTYRYRELAEALDEDKDYFSEIESEKNRLIIGAKLYKKLGLSVVSMMNNKIYANTNSEQLADMFSSRFGYYRDLVSGLDRLHLLTTPERNSTIHILLFGTNLIWLITRPLALITAFMLSIPLGVAVGLFMLFIINALGTANQDHTYDNVKVRYTRIREQLVNRLKELKLSKNETEDLLEQLDAIDKILENTREYKGLVNSLSDFIFSKHRSANEELALQRTLEKLANNDLFVMAAKLKTI